MNRKDLRHRIVNKQAVGGSVARAGIGTAINSPHQWGRGPDGFAKRLGSSFGKHVIKETVQAGVAAAHHENLRYQPSHLNGTWPRVKYAVKSTFVVPRTNKAGKTVALGRVSGNMAAGMASQLWMPAASVGAGVATGGVGLAADVGVNVTREFWPRHRKVREK
ncbi:MAG TPA: hypothetical protein VKU19_14350 [Bryobacteraceae bacterium]|nr:hypothetical protein [Bryobacteraceae bacterium]